MNNLDLKEKLNEYYKITKEIEKMLDENKYEDISSKLDKRQLIIDSINDKDRERANEMYINLEIDKIDKKIRATIMQFLDETKEEIKKYRKTKTVNSIYTRNSKEKLNIFSKKV